MQNKVSKCEKDINKILDESEKGIEGQKIVDDAKVISKDKKDGDDPKIE